MDNDSLRNYAVEEGFSGAEVIETEQIVFDPGFRVYCEENLCGQYGANYACPPDCGTAEDMKRRILSHRHALVLQSIWELSDFGDKATIKKAKNSHNTASIRLAKRLRAEGCDGFIIGSGGCAICTPCALSKGQPCAVPEYQYSCMSAYCIYVKKLAESCGLEYDCGEGLVAFFGMYVFD